jgi:flagellar biosynthetic protein FlhB
MINNPSEFILIYAMGFMIIYLQTNFSLVTDSPWQPRNLRSWIFFAATEEKTEAATPHRRQETRKKGQVAKSTDLNSAIVMMAIISVIYSFRGYLGENIKQYITYILSNTSILTSDQFIEIYKLTLLLCLKIMAPIFGVAIIAGLLVNFFQAGLLLSFEGITPKLSNISPLGGLKKMFSKKALVELCKTLLKVFIIGLLIFNQIKKEYPNILLVLDMDIVSSSDYLVGLMFRVSINAIAVFLILAVLDYVYQKWHFGESIKMSKDEVKKEMKQMEGDPLIKSKIRQKQRMMSMRRMMQSIPEATVVVTNPTHIAVALKYDENMMDAPKIIAKGAGYLAEKIKQKAADYKIPIIEDQPLARSLYKGSEIGDFVPVELYQAVAGVIATIYSLKNK